MIKEVKGDLIKMAKEGHFDVIMHGCNCMCTMGAGIAKTIREEFPIAYNVDCETKLGDISKLGCFTQCTAANDVDGYFQIVNLYTQYGYGGEQPAEYSAILSSLAMWLNEQYDLSVRIGIPWIGAGLGGLDINIVKKCIELMIGDLDVTLVEFDQ